MPHFTKVKAKIKDLVALKKAPDDLGYTYTESEGGQAVVKGYQGTTAQLRIMLTDIRHWCASDGGGRRPGGGLVWKPPRCHGRQRKFLQQRYSYHKR